MFELFRRSAAILFAGVVGLCGAASAQPAPSGDPPARVGRLAFIQGTVSYHDAQQDTWSSAVLNTPITMGDSLWTEPSGHDEIAISGTRVRMDGNTQLDVVELDDNQTRLELDQGRLDIKTFASFETGQPYQVVTPRGTVILRDQGDYYVHAGSTDDPTILGVRAGAAEFQSPNGQTVGLHSGEVAEVSGDGSSIEVRKIETAPPPMPAYWAQRDQQITYAPVQYLGADVTGYEDLAAYGSWSNDPEYGEVWMPRAVAADWAPYTVGSWSYVAPWGWTWVDSEPWGFAPYHYGRWAHRNNRWFWVPPERQEHAVYAPALVAFVGGTELGVAIGAQNRQPVGWFPLGPREAYVPPYTTDRAYYQRINANARVPEAALNDRWQRAERHEALLANQQNEQLANRRFATVVSAQDFARSRPVQQVRLHVAADRLAAAPVAPVAAPPAPTMALAAQAPNRPGQPAHPQPQTANRPGQPPMAQTRLAGMETIARPAPNAAEQHHAPGPRIVSTQPTAPGAKPALPHLAPHTGNAPLMPGAPKPNTATASPQVPSLPSHPGEPPRPNEQRPGQPPQPNQAVQPPQHPGQTAPQPPRQGQAEPPKPQTPAQAQRPAPVAPPSHPAEPPRPQQAQQPAPPPPVQHQAAPTPPPQAAHPAPPPQAPPQQAHVPTPPPVQHQAPPPPQAAHSAPQPQAQPPQQHPQQAQQPAQKKEEQR